MARPPELQKIEKLGLTEEVYRLRQTMSLTKTCEHINATHPDIHLWENDIVRWEKRYNIQYAKNTIAVGVPLDTYNTIIDGYNRSVTHICRIEGEMDKKKDCLSPDLINSYTNALDKKHKIALDMVKLEKEMMNTANLKKITQAAIDAMREVNNELKSYIDELVIDKGLSIPPFDIMQRYQEKLQAYQEEIEEMKRK